MFCSRIGFQLLVKLLLVEVVVLEYENALILSLSTKCVAGNIFSLHCSAMSRRRLASGYFAESLRELDFEYLKAQWRENSFPTHVCYVKEIWSVPPGCGRKSQIVCAVTPTFLGAHEPWELDDQGSDFFEGLGSVEAWKPGIIWPRVIALMRVHAKLTNFTTKPRFRISNL